MKNYAFLWFRNIVALLEKRPYAVFNVLLFSLFVGSFRLFAEWALGGFYPQRLLVSLLTVSGFYWFSFFAIAAVLKALVAQPWRVSINVILVGVFLGVFPPVVDAAVGGTGFNYSFMWDLWADWRWGIYNPEKNIPAGEAVVLWVVIALTGLYVQLKTASPVRAGAALALGYAAVMVIAGVPATLSERVRAYFEWPLDHRSVMQVWMQYALSAALYLVLQPAYAAALVRNAWRGAPYLALCLAGAALGGGISSTAGLYAAVLALVLAAAFAFSHRSGADLEDRRFFGVTLLLVLTAVAAANSTAVVPLAFIALSAMAGDRLPRWAAKGAFAAAPLLLGLVAAAEHQAFEAPRWWITFVPRPLDPAGLQTFGVPALLTVPAVFAAAALFTHIRGSGAARR